MENALSRIILEVLEMIKNNFLTPEEANILLTNIITLFQTFQTKEE